MAGPYAHITLLHELMRPGKLESIFPPLSENHSAVVDYFPYVVLGSVSPDYPNLARANIAAPMWADAMHYTRACEMISSGIKRVKSAKGITRSKQVAWLLGYCAHVATDVTIHPIVQAKVGAYAENQRQHRICEMNQDSYIYRRMNLGEVGVSDNFALTVARCSNSSDRSQLDSDIVTLWHAMFKEVHPELFAAHPPDSTLWHREFVAKASDCRAGEIRLFPLAGVISARIELPYPSFDKIDQQFIDDQLVPTTKPFNLSYDDIFDRAATNVAHVWRMVERAINCDDRKQPFLIGNWNLDDGLDEQGRLVFWENI
jgi:hypothetical protein